MIKRLVKMSVEDLLHNYHAACGFPNGQPMRQEIRSELERRIEHKPLDVHKPILDMTLDELIMEIKRTTYLRDLVVNEINVRHVAREEAYQAWVASL